MLRRYRCWSRAGSWRYRRGRSGSQEGFLAAAAEHLWQVGVQIGYHEAFSHRIMGGADVILSLAV
ncbi:hypothetical protein KCP70_09365 [Salmonella enterica subsp. enterica]|nr:hypothetical protein KCP70_09365 [Salmonella enterica subsp. enterica]